MQYCASCKSPVMPVHRFCGSCGAPQGTPHVPTEPFSQTTQRTMRSPGPWPRIAQILCAAWIIASVAWIIFCEGSVDWIILLTPSIIACVWPLARSVTLTEWIEKRESTLHKWSQRADGHDGRIARYLFVPFLNVSLWVWTKTRRVSDPHLRAGLRATTVLYLGALMVGLGILAAYLFVMAVLMVVALIFVVFALLAALHVFFAERESGSSQQNSLWRGVAKSRVRKDFFGDRREDLYDDRGRKIGEVRRSSGLFGEKDEVFRDDVKVGERRRSSTITGEPKWNEYVDDEKVGESRTRKDFWGDPVEEHFDDQGTKTGESREYNDLFGGRSRKHTGKD
jgi:uncharacterized membrane protein